MQIIKISSKRQLTLPAKVCRILNLEKGDRLLLEVKENRLVLTRIPKDFTRSFSGTAKGVYGGPAAAVDEYVRKERETWE